MAEAHLMRRIQMALAQAGPRVFRNNVGLFKTFDGRKIRTGLCVGSSDLIGWNPVEITPDMVGSKVAVFTAVEVKQPGQRPTKEQAFFLAAVKLAGGIACVAHSEEEAREGVQWGR